MSEIVLSIVTPAYNRGHLLEKCYKSLCQQTSNDFEWIIVDDGSSDNTEEVVNKFINADSKMNIVYVKKTNGGKHTAMNASHPYLRGKYVLILDSDDYLTADAVEKVIKGWYRYSKNPKVATLVFLRGDTNGSARAYGFQEYTVGDYRKLRRVNVTSSDCCEVFRADLFRKYPYSEFEGERFLSESELWNRLAENGYKMVYINEVVYICEYLEGGLTDSGRKMRIRNPLGGMCTSMHFFERVFPVKTRFKKGLLYVCYGFFAKMTPLKIITIYKGHYLLKVICLLPGYLMYRLWKYKYTD